MPYYSLRYTIHSNDVINNGHDIIAPAAFKKHLRELLYFKPSVQVQSSTTQPEQESLKDWKKEKGELRGLRDEERKM